MTYVGMDVLVAVRGGKFAKALIGEIRAKEGQREFYVTLPDFGLERWVNENSIYVQ